MRRLFAGYIYAQTIPPHFRLIPFVPRFAQLSYSNQYDTAGEADCKKGLAAINDIMATLTNITQPVAASTTMANTAQHITLACDDMGHLYDEAKCWAGEMNAAFPGLEIEGCRNYDRLNGLDSSSQEEAEANAKAINEHSRYSGPPIGYFDTVSTSH